MRVFGLACTTHVAALMITLIYIATLARVDQINIHRDPGSGCYKEEAVR
jgi:hypothetical protein